jgi:hypothetical protein
VTPIEKFETEDKFVVPRKALFRAILALDAIEALALIRVAFGCEPEGKVGLEDARMIYSAIKRSAGRGA